jgi:hypothetical protein
MMPFEDIAFQLVDLPPLSNEYMEPWVYDLVRQADLLWVVVEHSGSLESKRCPGGRVPPTSSPSDGSGSRRSWW